MIRKGLAVAVILLFVGMCVVPSTAIKELRDVSTVSFDGNTLYVGGSGPNNYTTIQSAIDDAVDDDTVFVYSGTYYENIIIEDKSIYLIGENKNSTIIDAKRYNNVIEIYADYVVLRGFTIQNSTLDGWYGGIELFVGNYNRISDNIITDNADGITGEGYNDNQITNNIISNNEHGIYMCYCERNVISGNNFSNNEDGIYIGGYVGNYMLSQNNKITYNEIYNNGHGVTVVSSRNTISNNNFIDNNNDAGFFGSKNHWYHNYWNEPRNLPKVIHGKIGLGFLPFPLIPWINIDWEPATEPNDIGV